MFIYISVFFICSFAFLGKQLEYIVFVKSFIHNQHFLPQGGESIIPHLLCCDAFAVHEYSFIRRRLASVVFLIRELSRLI